MTSPFRFNHEADLVFYFQDLDAATGCGSSFDVLANLALSGIPDGGTIAQPTKARMRIGAEETPSDRGLRIRDTLANVPAQAHVLAAHYLPGKWHARRMEHDACLSPLQREFRTAAGVVQRIANTDALRAVLMTRSSNKPDRQEAKADIARIKRLAERAVEQAQRAYQDAAGKGQRVRTRAAPDRSSDIYDAMAADSERFGGRTRPLTSDERANRGDR